VIAFTLIQTIADVFVYRHYRIVSLAATLLSKFIHNALMVSLNYQFIINVIHQFTGPLYAHRLHR